MKFGINLGGSEMQKRLKIYFVAVIMIILLGFFITEVAPRYFVTTIPPASLTHLAMHMTKRRILRYAHAHDRLPMTLEELPIIEGYDNGLEDAWGRTIRYEASQDGSVRLISLGKDGTQGGEGDDYDVIAVFMPKDVGGHWQQEVCDWVIDPFGHVPKLGDFDYNKKEHPESGQFQTHI